ncbi:MAG: hypothetical protein ACRDK0_14680, partial [Solirubrobacteraceae bacterium]
MAPRLAPIAGLLLFILAAPAGAHDVARPHKDTRTELAFVRIADAVETVDAAAGTEGEGLPLSWCGAERTTDDVEHAVFDQSLPQFKLVYAHPSDRASRFAQWRDALQANVSLIGRLVGPQSGGRKAPRFDMGTSCGARYVDIQVVRLPAGRAAYVNNFGALQTAVRARVAATDEGPRNVIVVADRLSNSPAGRWSGVGESYLDERAGSENSHNRGQLFSALWIPDVEPAPGADPDGWWPEGMLHEMTHNLGAVQELAPHATPFGHCWDGYDVMCYADGGPDPMTVACPKIAGVMSQVYDCGADDYFNPQPSPGSYLATSWNTYDNVFLGGCQELAPACGGSGSGTPALPVSTAEPQLQGTAVVGHRLTAGTGTWINSPHSFGYSWERSDGAAWSRIAGVGGPSYTLDAADAGRRVRVRVLATNLDGSTAAYSQPAAVASPQPTATWQAAALTAGQPLPTAPPGFESPAGITAPRSGKAALRVGHGRGRGKRLGTIAFRVTGAALKASPVRVRLAKGRYELALCVTAGAASARP